MNADKPHVSVDAEWVQDLLKAALAADYTTLRRLGNQAAKLLSEQGDEKAARAVRALLRRRNAPLQASGHVEAVPRDSNSRLPLVEELTWPTTASLIDRNASRAVDRFLEDARHIDLLTREGLSARLGLLLYGPPGTGKSLLAGHIAAQLGKPIYVARLDSLISSRLGDTSKNIRGVFDFVPTKNAVLFLDEMDAVAKLRDDKHELGELKRVVNTVLQGLDSLPDDVVVIAATNHHQLLDPAIWRRFPYKAELKLPEEDMRTGLWEEFLGKESVGHFDVPLLAAVSGGLSGADIEQVALAARRRALLSDDRPNTGHVILAIEGLRAGGTPTIDGEDMTAEEKRQVARLLRAVDRTSAAELGRTLGVSRQMAHRYVKEFADG